MFVRVTSTPNSPRKAVKVVESVRDGLKVKQVLLHYIGVASTEEEILKLKQLGNEFIAQELTRREVSSQQLSLFEPTSAEEKLEQLKRLEDLRSKKKGRKAERTFKEVGLEEQLTLSGLFEEERVTEGIHDVAGYVYDDLGYNKVLNNKKDKELLRDIVLMRLANPSSKLKAKSILEKRYGRFHNIDAIYRVMDKLHDNIEEISKLTFNKTKSLTPQLVDIVFLSPAM